MSKAREQENQLLYQLLRTTRRDATRKAVFVHYWPAFLQYFHKRTDHTPEFVRKQYAEAFARLLTELEDETTLLPKRSIGELLLFLGQDIIQPDPPFSPTLPTAYFDSDLLLTLLPTGDPVLEQLIYDTYAPAFALIHASQYETTGAAAGAMEGTLEQTAFHDAYLILLSKIREGKVIAPMTSLLFTYFYRIYANKVREAHRKENNSSSTEDLTSLPPTFFAPAAAPENKYWESLLHRFQSLRRYDFNDEKAFVHYLLNRLDKKCHNLLYRHFIDGVELKTMAHNMNMAPSALRSQALRCRKQVERLLSTLDHE